MARAVTAGLKVGQAVFAQGSERSILGGLPGRSRKVRQFWKGEKWSWRSKKEKGGMRRNESPVPGE